MRLSLCRLMAPVSFLRCSFLGGGSKPRSRVHGKQSVAQPWGPVDSYLAGLNLFRTHVPGDGCCQFHSIATQSQHTHSELRRLAVEYIRSHPQSFIAFVTHHQLEHYLARMCRNSTWGDHLTLQALAFLLSRPVHVVTGAGVTVIPTLDSVRAPVPIWVAYNGVHYDAALPVQARPVLFCPHYDPCRSSSSQNDSHVVDIDVLPTRCTSERTLCVASCNVTSLKQNAPLLVDLPEVLGLQETRHTSLSPGALSSKMRSLGYDIFFGRPMVQRSPNQARQSRTIWNGRPGGVALAVKSHIPAQIVPIGDSELRQKLWQSGRWLHVIVAYGSARRAIHVVVAYGFAGTYSHNTDAQTLNEAFLSDVFEEASSRMDLPCIILADFNRQPQDSCACHQACHRGGWVDSALAGCDLSPTHFPPHGLPRRLDAVFLNKTAAVSFKSYSVLDDTGLPSHRPVQVCLSLPALQLTHLQLCRPRSFPAEAFASITESQSTDLFLACWSPFADSWQQFLLANDSEGMFRVFSSAAEAFLCSKASLPVGPRCEKLYCGRGALPKFVKRPSVAVSRPIDCGGAQTTAKERCLRKLARQLEEISRSSPAALGCWPRRLQHLWQLAQKRAASCGLSFNAESLRQCRDEAVKMANSLSKARDFEALSRWRQKIQLDFKHHKRDTFRWFNRPYRCSQPFLKRGASFTACPDEIDNLVRAVWAPIMQRGPTEPVPSWEVFLSHYGHLIPEVPVFQLAPLTALRLRKILGKMSSHSSSGLDGWEVTSLKALPDHFLDGLCVLFDTIEDSGSWPASLTSGYLSLIPKPDSTGSPDSLRPLSILSVVYRLWASARLQELLVWQETWAHSSQTGFRPLHECSDSWYPLALEVEKSLLDGNSLAGCFLDFEKAFDLVPLHEIILPLACRLGLPPTLVRCLGNLYSRLARFFKHPKGFGSAISSNRGIVQGCPISVVLLNLLVSIFLRLSEHNLPHVCPCAYADDISGSAQSTALVASFLDLAGSFASVTGQRLKSKKCNLWATSQDLRSELACLRLAGEKLPVIADVRYLGAQFGFHAGAPVVERSQLLSSFQDTVARAACLPLSAEDRALLIGGAPIPKALHGCELTAPDKAALLKLRTVVLRAVWRGRSSRIPEVLTSLFFAGHRLDPVQVCMYRPLLMLRRMCCKSSIIKDLCASVWASHGRSPSSGICGPIFTALSSLKGLGWGWDFFLSFSRPFLPPVPWLQCSRGWLLHQIRAAIRQAQLSAAAARCAHLAGFTILDRHMSLVVLNALKRHQQAYSVGTLKAVLANAIKTAVILHKAKWADSEICPFCDQHVPETTTHMYEECSRWALIRARFPAAFDARLPVCSRLTGIACLSQQTLNCMRSLYTQQPVIPVPAVSNFADRQAESRDARDAVIVCVAGFCREPSMPVWRRAGFSIRYSTSPHSLNTTLPLMGPEQCAKRAAASALCHVLAMDHRRLRVQCACPSLLLFWQQVTSPGSLSSDGENIDLILQARKILEDRSAPVRLELLTSAGRTALYKAAQADAKRAAACHCDAAYTAAHTEYLSLRVAVTARQRMLLAVVLARSKYAKEHRLLTFQEKPKPDHPDLHNNAPDSSPEYLTHPANFEGHCFVLGPCRSFCRALRFSFCEFLYQAITWYLSRLRWPDQPIESTRGITYLELSMDFELCTGIFLPGSHPGSDKRAGQSSKARIRRGAASQVRSVFDQVVPAAADLAHDIEKVALGPRPRFRCKACHRSGAWDERSRFLKFSCAGSPETTAQAVRRHRLAHQSKLLAERELPEQKPASLGERAIFFADAFRSVIRKNSLSSPPVLDFPVAACRSLSGFSLPASAGLKHRPILLAQSRVSDEIGYASSCFLAGSWPDANAWHLSWFPRYDSDRPHPLWRPREPD